MVTSKIINESKLRDYKDWLTARLYLCVCIIFFFVINLLFTLLILQTIHPSPSPFPISHFPFSNPSSTPHTKEQTIIMNLQPTSTLLYLPSHISPSIHPSKQFSSLTSINSQNQWPQVLSPKFLIPISFISPSPLYSHFLPISILILPSSPSFPLPPRSNTVIRKRYKDGDKDENEYGKGKEKLIKHNRIK